MHFREGLYIYTMKVLFSRNQSAIGKKNYIKTTKDSFQIYSAASDSDQTGTVVESAKQLDLMTSRIVFCLNVRHLIHVVSDWPFLYQRRLIRLGRRQTFFLRPLIRLV